MVFKKIVPFAIFPKKFLCAFAVKSF